jgi:type I restriction enzyme M protein
LLARLRLRRPDQSRQGSLGIFCLKDESLSNFDNLPARDVIAAESVEDMEAALEQFREILADMGPVPC